MIKQEEQRERKKKEENTLITETLREEWERRSNYSADRSPPLNMEPAAEDGDGKLLRLILPWRRRDQLLVSQTRCKSQALESPL